MYIIMFYILAPVGVLLIVLSIGWMLAKHDSKTDIEALAAEHEIQKNRMWAEAYDKGWFNGARSKVSSAVDVTAVDLITPIPITAKVP